jgi:hypothetical protein
MIKLTIIYSENKKIFITRICLNLMNKKYALQMQNPIYFMYFCIYLIL